MTLKNAISNCKSTNLTGRELVEYARGFVRANMAYAYDNSFDMPSRAFEKGRGYCWQQAKALQRILNALGFECRCVYAVRNRIAARRFMGSTVGEHVSGHVWCRVKLNGAEHIDVCSCGIEFTPLSEVRRWNSFVGFWAYWGSAYVNRKRFKEIMKR